MTIARTAREAVADHRRNMQRIVSCVVDTPITSRDAPEPSRIRRVGGRIRFLLGNGRPIRLRGSASLSFVATDICCVDRLTNGAVAGWRVVKIGHVYAFTTSSVDEVVAYSVDEVVAYHWHPYGEGAVEFPHVHIGPAMSRHDSVVRAGEAHKIHLPTGEVSLADVLRLAITELEVEPRRDDWESVLGRVGTQT